MKRRLYIAAGAVAALLVAFVAGRYSRPARVVETVKVETRIETVTEWRERVVEKRVAGPERIVERIVEKPGVERIVERTIERGPVTTDTVSDGQGTGATTAESTSATSKVTETGRPGWSAGLAGTWHPGALSTRPERLTLELDRRLFGTLWLGVRASAEPDLSPDPRVGLALRLEW